ncbi:ATP synthase subunit I [Zavarzinia aquatilis]|uniref:ATP synthase subunit I n=1 Tax=Zavarzinia aquatilis TaxID=2211142 RepID=A0A317EG68_9PROT|nr:ATP synthase subunit I [Zavarzinia aquatilis]PWR25741.1 ATP synthase subunit I [Zavarzinia aquatilis]
MPADSATMLLQVLAGLAAGVAFGLLYFKGLWWQVRRFEARRRTLALVGVMVLRFALLGGGLLLAALAGAVPLLSAAVGILAGRWLVMRQVRGARP